MRTMPFHDHKTIPAIQECEICTPISPIQQGHIHRARMHGQTIDHLAQQFETTPKRIRQIVQRAEKRAKEART